MENFKENIELVADMNASSWDFSNFCKQLHGMIWCKKENLQTFSDVLQTFLEKTDRNDHDKKRFFISHCQIFRPAFCSMYKLYVDKEYTLDFMGLIKQRTDGNSSWGWEINRGS